MSKDPLQSLGFNSVVTPSYLRALYVFSSNSSVGSYDLLGLYGVSDGHSSPGSGVPGPTPISPPISACVCDAGATKGLRPRPGYTKTTDGCTLSPDSWTYYSFFTGIHVVNFKPSCTAHDYCYQECGADKHQCDLDFLDSLKAACKSHADSHPLLPWGDPAVLPACYAAALLYYKAVDLFGNADTYFGFDNLQEAACEPCCCAKATP